MHLHTRKEQLLAGYSTTKMDSRMYIVVAVFSFSTRDYDTARTRRTRDDQTNVSVVEIHFLS